MMSDGQEATIDGRLFVQYVLLLVATLVWLLLRTVGAHERLAGRLVCFLVSTKSTRLSCDSMRLSWVRASASMSNVRVQVADVLVAHVAELTIRINRPLRHLTRQTSAHDRIRHAPLLAVRLGRLTVLLKKQQTGDYAGVLASLQLLLLPLWRACLVELRSCTLVYATQQLRVRLCATSCLLAGTLLSRRHLRRRSADDDDNKSECVPLTASDDTACFVSEMTEASVELRDTTTATEPLVLKTTLLRVQLINDDEVETFVEFSTTENAETSLTVNTLTSECLHNLVQHFMDKSILLLSAATERCPLRVLVTCEAPASVRLVGGSFGLTTHLARFELTYAKRSSSSSSLLMDALARLVNTHATHNLLDQMSAQHISIVASNCCSSLLHADEVHASIRCRAAESPVHVELHSSEACHASLFGLAALVDQAAAAGLLVWRRAFHLSVHLTRAPLSVDLAPSVRMSTNSLRFRCDNQDNGRVDLLLVLDGVCLWSSSSSSSSSSAYKLKMERAVAEATSRHGDDVEYAQLVLSPLVFDNLLDMAELAGRCQTAAAAATTSDAKPEQKEAIIGADSLYLTTCQLRYRAFKSRVDLSSPYSRESELILGDVFGTLRRASLDALLHLAHAILHYASQESAFRTLRRQTMLAQSSAAYHSWRLLTSLTQLNLIVSADTGGGSKLLVLNATVSPLHYAECNLHDRALSAILTHVCLRVMCHHEHGGERRRPATTTQSSLEVDRVIQVGSFCVSRVRWQTDRSSTTNDVEKQVALLKRFDAVSKRLTFLWQQPVAAAASSSDETGCCECFSGNNCSSGGDCYFSPLLFQLSDTDANATNQLKPCIYSMPSSGECLKTTTFGRSILVDGEMSLFSHRRLFASSVAFAGGALADVVSFVVIAHLESEMSLVDVDVDVEEKEGEGDEQNDDDDPHIQLFQPPCINILDGNRLHAFYSCSDDENAAAAATTPADECVSSVMWPPFFSDELTLYVRYLPALRNVTHTTKSSMSCSSSRMRYCNEIEAEVGVESASETPVYLLHVSQLSRGIKLGRHINHISKTTPASTHAQWSIQEVYVQPLRLLLNMSRNASKPCNNQSPAIGKNTASESSPSNVSMEHASVLITPQVFGCLRRFYADLVSIVVGHARLVAIVVDQLQSCRCDQVDIRYLANGGQPIDAHLSGVYCVVADQSSARAFSGTISADWCFIRATETEATGESGSLCFSAIRVHIEECENESIDAFEHRTCVEWTIRGEHDENTFRFEIFTARVQRRRRPQQKHCWTCARIRCKVELNALVYQLAELVGFSVCVERATGEWRVRGESFRSIRSHARDQLTLVDVVRSAFVGQLSGGGMSLWTTEASHLTDWVLGSSTSTLKVSIARVSACYLLRFEDDDEEDEEEKEASDDWGLLVRLNGLEVHYERQNRGTRTNDGCELLTLKCTSGALSQLNGGDENTLSIARLFDQFCSVPNNNNDYGDGDGEATDQQRLRHELVVRISAALRASFRFEAKESNCSYALEAGGEEEEEEEEEQNAIWINQESIGAVYGCFVEFFDLDPSSATDWSVTYTGSTPLHIRCVDTNAVVLLGKEDIDALVGVDCAHWLYLHFVQRFGNLC